MTYEIRFNLIAEIIGACILFSMFYFIFFINKLIVLTFMGSRKDSHVRYCANFYPKAFVYLRDQKVSKEL